VDGLFGKLLLAPLEGPSISLPKFVQQAAEMRFEAGTFWRYAAVALKRFTISSAAS
jgi:hypothetical protein